MSIAVLEESIRVKEGQLSDLKKNIDVQTRKVDSLNKRLVAAEASIASTHKIAVVALASDEFQAAQLRKDISNLEAIKKSVQAEIGERKRYLTEQEDLIAATVEDGNMQLKSIQYEIAPIEDTKLQLESDIALLDEEKTNLLLEIEQIRIEVEATYSTADSTQADVQKSIDAAEANLKNISEKSKKVTADIEKKLRDLRAKEEELTAKQKATAKEHADLQTERRRWESTKSLYGVE